MSEARSSSMTKAAAILGKLEYLVLVALVRLGPEATPICRECDVA